MVSVGLQTFSSIDQRAQVDTNNRTLLLLKSGQFTASDSSTVMDAWFNEQADIASRLTSAALLCVRCPYPGLHPSIGSHRGGKKLVNFYYLRGGAVTFQYYIYDNLQPILGSRLGVQSFDGDGNLIYDSNDYPMKMLGLFMDAGGNPAARLKYSASHSNIAVANLSGGYQFSIFEDSAESWSSYLYMNGSNIYQYDVYDPESGAFAGVPGYGNYGITIMNNLVIDTTNTPSNYTRP